MNKRLKENKAFTLIELLAVIAILSVLVLLATPKLLDYLEEAELVRIQHDVKIMEQEMKIALIDSEIEINKWDKNNKNLGVLAMQNKLFEKEGVAERVDASHLSSNNFLASKNTEIAEFARLTSDSHLGTGGNLYKAAENLGIGGVDYELELTSIDETYKVVPEKYKNIIKTKLNGTFYANEDGKVYYEHDKPIEGEKSGNKIFDCPFPLPDYDFEPATGTIVKWYGTATHLVIPEAFKAVVNGEEECVPVRVIGKAAFMQGGFKSIIIPQSVMKIEEDAFKDNKIAVINIPHSVEYIGGNTFAGNNFGPSEGNSTKGDPAIIVRNSPSNITIMPGAFGDSNPTFRPISPRDLNVVFEPSSGKIMSGQPSGRVITIPESFWIGGVEYPVKQIDRGAYQGLGLISIILPSGLERIEDYAFAGNQLRGVTIPGKVNHIGNYAFSFNEVQHARTDHKEASIKTIVMKNNEHFPKVNKYGNLLENNEKVDMLNGSIKLLDHIFVTSIDNFVVSKEYKPYIEIKSNEPTNPIPPIVNGKLPDNIKSLSASSTSTWTGIYYDPWNAFDGKYDIMNNGWMANQQNNAWLAVEFDNYENINMVRMVNSTNVYEMGEYRTKDFRIEYYDENGKGWKVAYQGQMKGQTGWQEFEFESVGSHKQWRLWIINHGYGSSALVGIGEMQFLHK